MDENQIRPERIPGTHPDRDIVGRTTTQQPTEREVDIRRTMIMGRDLDTYGRQHMVVATPSHRALSWGPIMAGLMTSLVTSLLVGALFLGLGFDRSYGVFGGLTTGAVGLGAAIAMLLGVFAGSFLTGYVSDISTRAEAVLNGFMVGIMSIFTPVLLALIGTYGAATNAAQVGAQTLPRSVDSAGVAESVSSNLQAAVQGPMQNVQNSMALAADNAWQVFLVGALILGIATLSGYLGLLARERAIEMQASEDLDQATTY